VVGKSLESRFEEYGEVIGAALAHVDRRMPARWYLRGLMLPGGRKSVEPMAARVQPHNVRSAHQSMHHLVADAAWSDQGLLAAVTAQVLPALVKKDVACHWIIDDTGYGKKGTHSVGVARQYCGRLGKTDNCQVAVSLSIANQHGSLPIAYQLYLPQDWASDRARRKRTGVPAEIEFRTKGDMALEQIHQALNAGLPRGVVLADAAYGTEAAWRDQLSAWGLQYAVAVREHTRVWYGKHRPALRPPASPRGGRPRTRLVIDETHAPVTLIELAQALPARHWRQVTWRAGTNASLRSRFTALRVRAANLQRARPEQWLLVEWPISQEKPVHYWLCTLPANTPMKKLVGTAMGRWRIERDYQELKSELGLHHYEGRNWRGFHHHGSLCIAAYGFLMRERLRSKKNSARLKTPAVPKGLRPRGSGSNAAARSQLDRHDGFQSRSTHRQRLATLPVLRRNQTWAEAPLLTQ
jgi:SRSO17 transposase